MRLSTVLAHLSQSGKLLSDALSKSNSYFYNSTSIRFIFVDKILKHIELVDEKAYFPEVLIWDRT